MLGQIDAIAAVAVKDLERARRFYQETLGLSSEKQNDPEVVTLKSGSTRFNVYRSEFAGSNKATALTWAVGKELDRIMRELKAKGIRFEHYDLPGLTLEGDVHVGNGARIVWFKDPDGNLLNLVDM